MDWLLAVKGLVALILGRQTAGIAKVMLDLDLRELKICKPVVMRLGRGSIFGKRAIVHAREHGIDITPI